jgi:subtilisin family serine protease
MSTPRSGRALAACASVSLLLAGTVRAEQEPLALGKSVVPERRTVDRSTLRNDGDQYVFQGRPVKLLRSLTEYGIRLRGEREVRRESVAGFVPGGPAAGAEKAMQDALARLRGRADVAFAFPVLFNPETATRLMLTDEIVVRLKPGLGIADISHLLSNHGLSFRERIRGTTQELVLGFEHAASAEPLETANALAESALLEWAEPNFVQEYRRTLTPNDARYAEQWHLNNTGQSGALPDADVDASEAWDLTTGSSSTVIAIVDDSVETTHEDLAPNLYVNPGEIAGNGVDDDGNGFTDDVSGWDFANNDNNPNPTLANDDHGTAVAGVAAARGGNGLGVSGACPLCKILPVRIGFGSFPDSMYANAIRYAWRKAAVVNNSWGGGSPSSAIQTAIAEGIVQGRGGKGSAILFATGNSASGLGLHGFNGTGIPAGTHRYRFTYRTDVSGSGGADTAWLSWMLFGNQLVTFQAGLPAGVTTGGAAPWSVVTDPVHTDAGMCLDKALKAGTIGNSQDSFVDVVRTVAANTNFYLAMWISSAATDGILVQIDINNDGVFNGTFGGIISEDPVVATGVAFPAAHAESIAVAATSDQNCRSYYSQYGPEVDIAAPSNSFSLNLGVTTTDRTGAPGYDPGTYTDSFGGTSSATPLASGVAGLVLSRNPSLPEARVRQILQTTTDKVGIEAYTAGRNNSYGTGRINALKAVARALAASHSRLVEFDSDSASDMTVYNESLGQWTSRRSTTGTNDTVFFGGTGAVPVPGDFDGDGLTDRAVYYEASGLWYVRQSSNGAVTTTGYGGPGYKPVRGDYDGDGKSDIAVYHPASGLWFIRQSTTLTTVTVGYGGTGYDPVSGDWDGDGKSDVAVYHPPSGLWFLRLSATGTTFTVGYGGTGYLPVTGDYDGDGKTDVAVFHNASAFWFLRLSTTGATFSIQYGATGYTPVPGDYDGDGKTDIAVYHAGTGTWFARLSSTGTTFSLVFGGSGFVPVS